LAADQTPIIYHNFSIRFDSIRPELGDPLPLRKRSKKKFHYAVKQFTTEQFLEIGLNNQWHIQLPTLTDLLKKLPESMKFDAEIKYSEEVPFWERNLLVDRIL
jgi:hypothetical protein